MTHEIVHPALVPALNSICPPASEFDRKLAETLAANPEAVLSQMRQHREIVAGLREQIREKDKRIAKLNSHLITHFECPCGVKADSIDGHDCIVSAFGDGPEEMDSER